MDEPQAEQLVETLDHCGAPRAAGGADTSQAWYQLRARKRATFTHTQFSPLFSPRNTHAGWKVNRPYNTSMRW